MSTEEFKKAAAAEDAKFEAAHPELRDRNLRQKVQRGAVDFLREKHGLNDQQIHHLYHETGELRPAEVQHSLYGQTREYLAEKEALEKPTARNMATLVAARRRRAR
jgi:hypothetical protein